MKQKRMNKNITNVIFFFCKLKKYLFYKNYFFDKIIIGDNMKRGFTLIEMMAAVVVLIGILLIAIPSIMNIMNEKKETISSAMNVVIFDAGKLYLDDNNILKNEGLTSGDTYCVSLEILANEGYLTSPIVDPVTRKEIPLTKYAKFTVNANEEFAFSGIVNSDCNNH